MTPAARRRSTLPPRRSWRRARIPMHSSASLITQIATYVLSWWPPIFRPNTVRALGPRKRPLNRLLRSECAVASPDIAKATKTALAASWAAPAPILAVPTLHVDDDFRPAGNNVALLVADDGGPALLGGPWMLRKSPRKPLLRFTAFAKGRDFARMTAVDAADWVCDHHAEIEVGKIHIGTPEERVVKIIRVEDVSDPLITRDRATGA